MLDCRHYLLIAERPLRAGLLDPSAQALQIDQHLGPRRVLLEAAHEVLDPLERGSRHSGGYRVPADQVLDPLDQLAQPVAVFGVVGM